jgi:hypothetical protein
MVAPVSSYCNWKPKITRFAHMPATQTLRFAARASIKASAPHIDFSRGGGLSMSLNCE